MTPLINPTPSAEERDLELPDAASDSVNSPPQIALELLRVAVCPECDGSGAKQVQTSSRQYVTREMAIDAGDRSMEGSLYSDEQWEQRQCEWCYQREEILSEHSNEKQGVALLTPKPASAPSVQQEDTVRLEETDL